MGARKITRRTFITGAAGLHLGLFATRLGSGKLVIAKVLDPDAPDGAAFAAETEAALPADVAAIGIYLKIDSDDTVTVIIPRPDMGQGVRTSLAMHVAEELEADWSKLRIEQAQADSRYGSQTSAGSTSTRNFWTPTRQAGATARVMLTRAAAQQWGVDPTSCRCAMGIVYHDASGRQLSYGELAAAASKLPVPPDSQAPLKSPDKYTIIGQPTLRLDNPAIVDGSAIYGFDARVAGMKFVAIARPHPFGASVANYDDSAALKVPGVRQVLRFGSGIAVVADHTWAALAGREALAINWNPGRNADLDDATIRSRLEERLAGTLPALPPEAVTPVEAAYDLPYLAHAPMEPMNALADFEGDRCEVWVSTQAADGVQGAVAGALQIPRQNVTVNVMLTGGGFGRRLSADYATEAARLSREIGAPAQVVWSRDDDMRHDNYRPASHHLLRGGLNGDGQIVAWAHRTAIAGGGGELFGITDATAREELGLDQERPVYNVPNMSVQTLQVSLPIPTGAWRSVNNTQWTFANESFIDELAAAGGHDPFELRRQLLGLGRLRTCLELVAEKAGWRTPPAAGVGRGIACFQGFGSYVAHVVELTVSPAGTVKVLRVVAAVDCGIAVNPLGIQAQIEGAISDGLSTALKAEITIAGGGVEQTTFADYEWLHMAEMPLVEVHIVPSTQSPGGIGEPGFPSVSPAVANAIFQLTGRRIRRLPIRSSDLAGWAPGATATPTPTPTATPTATGEPAPGPVGTIYLPKVERG